MGPSPLSRDHDALSGAEEARRFGVEEVYDEHAEFVVRNLRRLGVSDAALEDAVQDVFVVVHRRFGDFEGRSSVRTWLFSILARIAKDHRRAAGRRAAKIARAERELATRSGVELGSEGPLDAVAKNEAVSLLHRLLAELDDEKRSLFVLVELEQLSVPEAAEALGLNVNTAYARLRAARRQFEERLGAVTEGEFGR